MKLDDVHLITLTDILGFSVSLTNAGDHAIKRGDLVVIAHDNTIRRADPLTNVIHGISRANRDVMPGEALSSSEIAVRGAFSFTPDDVQSIWITTKDGTE